MLTPLIATKLNIPPLQRELVPRPRLFERLNQGFESKLTLLSAPAGYGKTMLLAAWARQCSIPLAWVSLDEGDNDPVRFLLYLTSALKIIQPGFGDRTLGLLHVAEVPPQEQLLANLLNEITQLEKPTALVLDDYHLINAPAVHQALIYLIRHFPPLFHLMIASRSDPPLQLARLRARYELTELRLEDLCFTAPEAALFCNQVMKLDLTIAQVSELHARTEGWIAGLQLAAIPIQSAANREEFIQLFSGSNRFILDYLVEEVLRGQPAAVQSFLMKTSILDRITGPLCDALTGQNDGQAVLEQLEQDNLFIIPLDEQRSWYRYHQLFRDLLAKQAWQRFPGEVEAGHRLASRWFEQHGGLEDAIEHALAGSEYERAAGLIQNAAPAILMHSQIYTFRNWVARLPIETVHAHHELILFYAWALVLSDAPVETIESWLKFVDQEEGRVSGEVCVIRGFLFYRQGDILPTTRLMQQALDHLPPGENLFRSVAGYILSTLYLVTGEFETGDRALEEVAQACLEKGQLILAAGALCTLAEIHLRLGQQQAAREDYERVLVIAQDKQGRPLPVSSRARIRLGEIWREWNDLDLAERYCQEGLELSGQLNDNSALFGYLTLSGIRQARGDPDGAQAALQKAAGLAQQTEYTGLDDLIVAFYRAALDIRRGRLAEAETWLQQRGLESGFDPADLDQKDDYYKYHLLKYELLVGVRWWLAAGRPEQALAVLGLLLPKMETQGRTHLVIEALLLSALARQQLSAQAEAQALFARCLGLAEPGGYTRLFLDEGASIIPLLQNAIHQEDSPVYAHRLLAALEQESPSAHIAEPSQKIIPDRLDALVEPLTGREIELLELIAAGLSNREISQRLFISIPTVKWHTGNIFSKLGVRNRTQAVAQARSLGLLPAD